VRSVPARYLTVYILMSSILLAIDQRSTAPQDPEHAESNPAFPTPSLSYRAEAHRWRMPALIRFGVDIARIAKEQPTGHTPAEPSGAATHPPVPDRASVRGRGQLHRANRPPERPSHPPRVVNRTTGAVRSSRGSAGYSPNHACRRLSGTAVAMDDADVNDSYRAIASTSCGSRGWSCG